MFMHMKKVKEIKVYLGHNAIFTPEVIDDIHIKAQLGRYRMRGNGIDEKNSNI